MLGSRCTDARCQLGLLAFRGARGLLLVTARVSGRTVPIGVMAADLAAGMGDVPAGLARPVDG